MRGLIEVGLRFFSFMFRPLRAGPEQAVLCLWRPLLWSCSEASLCLWWPEWERENQYTVPGPVSPTKSSALWAGWGWSCCLTAPFYPPNVWLTGSVVGEQKGRAVKVFYLDFGCSEGWVRIRGMLISNVFWRVSSVSTWCSAQSSQRMAGSGRWSGWYDWLAPSKKELGLYFQN